MATSNSAIGKINVTQTAESNVAQSSSRIAGMSVAERRMREGRRLILIGFVVAVVGIIAYCVVGLSAPAPGTTSNGLEGMVAPSLGVIGLGTLLWLIGSIVFLIGGMDSNTDDRDLDF